MTEPLTILALDPGEKVGWARGVVNLDDPEARPTDFAHGIDSLQEMALGLLRTVRKYDVLVYETFRLFPGSARTMIGSDLPTAQFVGMARLAAWQKDWKLKSQGPDIKKTATKTAPPWLQEIIANEPLKHDDAHNVDALLHLWHYVWSTYVAN